jgi:hypothetical protein
MRHNILYFVIIFLYPNTQNDLDLPTHIFLHLCTFTKASKNIEMYATQIFILNDV